MAMTAGQWRERYLEWFHGVAAAFWRRADQLREQIASAEQWRRRRNYLKAVFIDALGGLPQTRTPLRAKCLGRLHLDGYDIERVVFESLPGFVVTANVYVPQALQQPAPAVLVACGHAENGKAYEVYRILATALALKGYVVLIYDPVGQGERRMYLDADGRPQRGGCTSQHTHVGVQLAASGLSLARFMVWDSMRAIDYLAARPDVDATRIGMTGASGGGTNTAYTAALDERVAAAMPVCYITSLQQRQRSGLIADYEQNLYGQIDRTLDHAEYLAMVAPRPVCVGAATEDFFPLAGARESWAAARKIYELLGAAEKCEIVVADGKHGYLPELRRAAYRFFGRWLGGGGDGEEPDVELPDEEDIQCLGRVGADGTFRVLLAAARERAAAMERHRLAGPQLREEIALHVAHVSELVSVGEWQEREGLQVAEIDPCGAPPIMVVRRREGPVRRVLVAAAEAEALAATSSGQFDGGIVLPLSVAPDLAERARASDERPGAPQWIHSSESFMAFYCQLLGRDWLFVRAAQILGGLLALGRGPYSLTARGALGPPALCAAVVNDRVEELIVEHALWSYADVLWCERHVLAPADVPWAVAGSHDLPALMASLAPRKLAVIGPRGADGRLLAADELPGLEAVRRAYEASGHPEALEIRLGR